MLNHSVTSCVVCECFSVGTLMTSDGRREKMGASIRRNIRQTFESVTVRPGTENMHVTNEIQWKCSSHSVFRNGNQSIAVLAAGFGKLHFLKFRTARRTISEIFMGDFLCTKILPLRCLLLLSAAAKSQGITMPVQPLRTSHICFVQLGLLLLAVFHKPPIRRSTPFFLRGAQTRR